MLPEGEPRFESEEFTDIAPSASMAAEFVREKVFRQLGDELPMPQALWIEKIGTGWKHARIAATIVVEKPASAPSYWRERQSARPRIGTDARKDMETTFGSVVFLELWVRVKRLVRRCRLGAAVRVANDRAAGLSPFAGWVSRRRNRQGQHPGCRPLHLCCTRGRGARPARLLEIFTRAWTHQGWSPGAKRPKSAIRGVLQLFQPLHVQWFGKTDMKTLKSAEHVRFLPQLSGPALVSAFI